MGDGATGHAWAKEGGVAETDKYVGFRNHVIATERECVHLRESGCPLSAGIWMSLDINSRKTFRSVPTAPCEIHPLRKYFADFL